MHALTSKDKRPVEDGLWQNCVSCEQPMFIAQFKENMKVCPHCDHHHRIGAKERLDQLFDRYTQVPGQEYLHDPLQFEDLKAYDRRLAQARRSEQDREALIVARASVQDQALIVACFDFTFIGGSMGIGVGHRFLQAVDLAVLEKKPLLCITASGGARMQEGVFSLMQMGKVSAAIARLKKHHLPYIVLLTDPTTGGVSASMATLGDVILAEPKALIGFTGPRVIEQTVRQKLPEGFQRSEFLMQAGLIDGIVHRHALREKLVSFLGLMSE